jgi:hypothetical protein
MSSGTRGARLARRLLLLAVACLALARSDPSGVLRVIGMALAEPNGQPGPKMQMIPGPRRAQSVAPMLKAFGAVQCSAKALDPEVTFTHDDTRQRLTVEFRNSGEEACWLGPDVLFGAWTDSSGDLKIPSCYQCGAMPPVAMEPAMLEPGQATALRLDWPLESAATTGSCRDAGRLEVAVDNGVRSEPGPPGVEFWLYQRRLRLCPPVNYGPYQPVDSAAPPAPVRLVLSADEAAYYPDEFMVLHLAAEDPGHILADSAKSCADLSLLTKLRRPDMPTKFTIAAVSRQSARPYLPVNSPGSVWQQELVPSATEKFPDEISYFIGTGYAAEHAASYVSPCRGGWETLARSADLETRLADVSPALPRWGKPIDGFAVALSADRANYRLGQDIPLHIACTRYARDWTSRAALGPSCEVALDAIDAAGRKVPQSSTEFFVRNTTVVVEPSTWHVKGDAVVESWSSLGTGGRLPAQPGTYHITATWLAHDDDHPETKPSKVQSPPLTVTITDRAP